MQPEIGQMTHAQLDVRLINAAILLEEESACGGMPQQMGIEPGDKLGQMLLDDRPGLLDGFGIGRVEVNELRQVLEIARGILCTLFSCHVLVRDGFHTDMSPAALKVGSCGSN